MLFDPQIPCSPPSVKAVAHLLTDAERHARVLVVDDDIENLKLVIRILNRAGFSDVRGLAEAHVLMPMIRDFEPDVVLLDLHMPDADGIELIGEIGAHAGPRSFLPVLVLTGDASVQARDAALAAGAKDYLLKPYESSEVVLRVRNLVETRLLHVELQRQNRLLIERFAARTEELEAAKVEILERLARASDFRDESTHAHTSRVGDLSGLLAKRLALPQAEVEQLRIAARLHDIGKIGLSDSILQKPGPLGTEEFEAQARHTIIGANILSGSRFPILRLAEQVALTHHEAWDGSGYPRGLAGEEIPLAGRIVAVADVFDALTHARPYKGAWSQHEALREIWNQRGGKFDPRVVDAFMALVEAGELETLPVEPAQPLRESPHGEMEAQLKLVGTHAESQRARIVRDVVRSRALR